LSDPTQGAEATSAPASATRRRDVLVARVRRPPPDERGTPSTLIVAICTALPVLVGLGAFLGILFMIKEPQPAADDANRFSRVLYAMPDRTTCRVMLFDNKSSQMSEGPVVPCDPTRKTTRYVEPREFKWGR
jgi:hypothetical protein